jgi:thioredoxin-like negative regulator of GroEL
MKPIVDGLEANYEGMVTVERLNIDDPTTSEAKVSYGFRLQPYFVLLDAEGGVVNTWTGGQAKETLDDALAAVVGP